MKKKKLKRKHIKIIEEFKAKLEKDKKSRIGIIKNENFKLLCDLTIKKLDLKNEIKILILELKELELPKKVINKIIEDMLFDPYICYYY